MLITLLMLTVALVPTAARDWELSQYLYGSTVRALCYHTWMTDNTLPSDPSTNACLSLNGTISIYYLVFSYSIRAIKLSKMGSKWIRNWLRTMPSEAMEKCLGRLNDFSSNGKLSVLKMFAYEVLLIFYICYRATVDLFESMFWEVSFPVDVFSTAASFANHCSFIPVNCGEGAVET